MAFCKYSYMEFYTYYFGNRGIQVDCLGRFVQKSELEKEEILIAEI